MDLIVEPDTYVPSINRDGNYIDKIPSFTNLEHGLKCMCGSRKDKVYKSSSIFSQHIKTIKHREWIKQINDNKANLYIENEKLKELVQNQKLIIARMEKEIQNRNLTLDYLTQQITMNQNVKVNNLLEFD